MKTMTHYFNSKALRKAAVFGAVQAASLFVAFEAMGLPGIIAPAIATSVTLGYYLGYCGRSSEGADEQIAIDRDRVLKGQSHLKTQLKP